MENIKSAILQKFDKHRLVFWYDEKKEFASFFEELVLDGVEKIAVEGNEFEVKHKVLREAPDGRFLLYLGYPVPAHEDNWLLDLELAHDVFFTDQEALYLQELGLGYHLKEFMSKHLEFFKAKDRRKKLKDILGKDDPENEIRSKMLAVLFKSDHINLNNYLQTHVVAAVGGDDTYDKELERYNLKDFYWKQIAAKFNAEDENRSIYELMLEVFEHNFSEGKNHNLSLEAGLMLKLWKDSVAFKEGFKEVSGKIAEDLGVEAMLQQAKLTDIMDNDLFELTEQKIIVELAALLSTGEISDDKLQLYVKQRENKFWYAKYADLYQALSHASALIAVIRTWQEVAFKDMEEGLKRYADTFYLIDQYYRKYIVFWRNSQQHPLLTALTEKVGKMYANDWLLPYNDQWQKSIDTLTAWPADNLNSQHKFFDTRVKPYLNQDQRLFVIISDALRYECAQELYLQFQGAQRLEAELDYMVSAVPSYTQMGMAALLPHKELSWQEGTDQVLADGMPTSGTPNRKKVLEANSGVRSTAISAEDFLSMPTKSEGRTFAKEHDLIYIYHNTIDKTGDDKISEQKVFEAVEKEFEHLKEVVKKVMNVNGSNILVTADHGFLYQHMALEESDFTLSEYKGDCWKENRRFVLGKGLKGENSTKEFSASQVGLAGEAEVLFPKSVNRFRVKGAGSRFVHGGTSPQEIVVPVIKLNKKKKDTVTKVDIDIIKTTDKITTNIMPVSFLQSDLISEKVLPRTIRAAIYADDDTVLSDQFQYNFDIEEGTERQREVKHRFQLMAIASGKYKNQRVHLKLEESVEGTSKWKAYKSFPFTLSISFTNDFDDF
ncbi:BREX-1 system phosphatase PglZ type A [Robertkochia sediminum]|uniref:BREX-1 system phosphatase PglZ type A n=1 Tax=Robertkochia sediminum TaxID=2785326 RepID=UPI001933807B|nr:BREX-1 system phosphatase PglZ type A [Robertkochia sediminum]MBL7471369.1 BREX-1 system phosphatase PglZ type A [Robertkochia sediminum]